MSAGPLWGLYGQRISASKMWRTTRAIIGNGAFTGTNTRYPAHAEPLQQKQSLLNFFCFGVNFAANVIAVGNCSEASMN